MSSLAVPGTPLAAPAVSPASPRESLRATMRLCALIGDPVAHSYSPAMHNAAFAHLGLDYAYAALRVAAADLATAINGARALGFVGLNVTAPHKEAALGLCTPDEVALRVGAVNTILYVDGAILGTNTDVHGVECALDTACERPIQRALVIGAGGAARAVVVALRGRGVALSLCARRPRHLEIAGESYEVRAIEALGERALAALVAEAELVVDTTPLGHGEVSPAWPVGALRDDAAVLELVVRAATPLSRACTARGLRAHLGQEMLLHQGALAFERYTGQPAPLAVMRAALDAAVEARGR